MQQSGAYEYKPRAGVATVPGVIWVDGLGLVERAPAPFVGSSQASGSIGEQSAAERPRVGTATQNTIQPRVLPREPQRAAQLPRAAQRSGQGGKVEGKAYPDFSRIYSPMHKF